jgi:hypothetical protein
LDFYLCFACSGTHKTRPQVQAQRIEQQQHAPVKCRGFHLQGLNRTPETLQVKNSKKKIFTARANVSVYSKGIITGLSENNGVLKRQNTNVRCYRIV